MRINSRKLTFEAGDDYEEEDADFIIYSIDVTSDSKSGYVETHYQQIRVYGSKDLRDKILELLREQQE